VKMKRFIVVMLLGVMLVSSLSCGGGEETAPTPTPSSVVKPSVGYVPQGWYLSDEDPYGTYEEPDGTVWGMIGYTDTEDADFVQIYYGDVPTELEGQETNSDALIGRAIVESLFEPAETGVMTASGQVAGYTKTYESDMDWYQMEIVFVLDSTCIDIYTIYDATLEDEAQVTSIIDSISP
jgi:hypothetical protein